jgi:hypothetical protein
LARVGIKCAIHDIGLTAVGASTRDLLPALRRLADEPVSPQDLAVSVENIKAGKFREQVSDDVSRKLWAEQNEGLIREIPKMALGLAGLVIHR